jgi:YebC/PmpR family DNA-binding regulatory protein
MSGHSKWHNIRIRKTKQDAERGKIFTRLAREIIVAARVGGGDVDSNNTLRIAVQKARAANMPADTIKRNIQRGTGEAEGITYEQVTYEGYGPAGVAVMVECLTENRNRTVSEVRHAFTKFGGNLSEPGSVAWQFAPKGVINIEKSKVTEDKLFEVAMEAGAEDLATEDEETYEVTTAPDALHIVQTAIEKAGIPIADAQYTLIPTNTVKVGADDAPSVIRFMEGLDDVDDVQQTYANFDIPEEVMKAVE